MLSFENPCGCYTTVDLSLNGQELLANPGTPPVSTYSVGVNLVAGQTYTLQLSGGGESANLSWATPSDLAPGIASAVAAAKAAKTAVVVVSDDTETEAADRASLNLPSAQNELISAVAAANPHTVVVDRRGRAGGHAVDQPGRLGGRRLVPGREQRHRAGRGPVRPGRSQRAPAGHVPRRPVAGARLNARPSSPG